MNMQSLHSVLDDIDKYLMKADIAIGAVKGHFESEKAQVDIMKPWEDYEREEYDKDDALYGDYIEALKITYENVIKTIEEKEIQLTLMKNYFLKLGYSHEDKDIVFP